MKVRTALLFRSVAGEDHINRQFAVHGEDGFHRVENESIGSFAVDGAPSDNHFGKGSKALDAARFQRRAGPARFIEGLCVIHEVDHHGLWSSDIVTR